MPNVRPVKYPAGRRDEDWRKCIQDIYVYGIGFLEIEVISIYWLCGGLTALLDICYVQYHSQTNTWYRPCV